MLVSHRFKFIYTKTAKTGGTSVESYFEKYCMKEGEWEFSHSRDEYISQYGIIGFRGNNRSGSTYYNHMSASRIKALVGEKIWNEYFKFCVIRNPYEKLISAFFHLVVRRNNIMASKEELIQLFKRWTRTEKGLMNDRDKYVIHNEICMDDFIRTENMLPDLERVCNHIGVPFVPDELPRLKSGFKPPDVLLHEYFDKETDQIVRKHYAFEFETFGYPFLFE